VKRLEILDYGRLAAAVAVVAFHYLFNGITNGKVASIDIEPQIASVAKYGYLGVEFFFLISGYVIFFSARSRTVTQFIIGRAVRLVPAFVPALILTATAAQFWGGERMGVTLPQVIANLTFFPHVFGFQYVDGVYWTLSYEITFYAAVVALLVLGQRSRMDLAVMLWPLGMVLATVVGLDRAPLAGRVYVFFAVGALFALTRTRRDLPAYSSLALAMGLALWFSVTRADAMSAAKGVVYSGAVIGAIVVAMFTFFATLSHPRVASLRLPGSQLAGALTYPIYLLHAHIGYMLLNQFATEQNKWVAYSAIVALISGLAYVLHIVFERKLGPVWRRIFEKLAALLWGFSQAGRDAKREVRLRAPPAPGSEFPD